MPDAKLFIEQHMAAAINIRVLKPANLMRLRIVFISSLFDVKFRNAWPGNNDGGHFNN
jgi:hypothetical protein